MGIVRVEVVRGNILNILSNAIVLPANTGLLEGRGVSTAIFQAAGRKQLAEACRKIGTCQEGKAVVTPGFRLKADYIIHTVVPRWIDGQHHEYERLCASYLAALNAADILSCASVSFPLLGSGNNGYDLSIAFDVAYQILQQFEGSVLNTAYLVIYGESTARLAAEKGIPYIELPEAYMRKNLLPSDKAPRQKGAMEQAIAQAGAFLGKKENWDAMLDVAFKIVRLIKEIK
ncbi:MAG: macro domain-containing protein [Clostridia bacterium]|nr:macro domain-containing protein [Clostridia bacterium]